MMTVKRRERNDGGSIPRFLDSWKAFAATIADVVLLLRRDGEILATNRAPFGFDAEKAIGHNVFDFAPHDLRAPLLHSLEGIFQGDESTVREIPSQLADGSVRWFSTHTGLMFEDERPVAATVVLRDVTKRVQAEQDLRTSEERYRKLVESDTRLQMRFRQLLELEQKRDSLVHMLVHDLRSPLTALCGNLELLRYDAEPLLPADIMVSLTEAEKLADDVSHMVGDMLDVSRFEGGMMPLKIVDTDLTSTIREAVLAVAPKPGVEICIGADVEGAVRCDRIVIMRVITNLVSNAVKATSRGGRVTVRATTTSHAHSINVTDSGEGIPPELQAHIFEKFWRAPSAEFAMRRGSGLGLTFCKLAVEAHGGRMDVHSCPGEGSTFEFTLPHQPHQTTAGNQG